jgi:hypothetical protein
MKYTGKADYLHLKENNEDHLCRIQEGKKAT